MKVKTRKGIGLISDTEIYRVYILFGEAGAKEAGLLRRVRGGEQQISFPRPKKFFHFPSRSTIGPHTANPEDISCKVSRALSP